MDLWHIVIVSHFHLIRDQHYSMKSSQADALLAGLAAEVYKHLTIFDEMQAFSKYMTIPLLPSHH